MGNPIGRVELIEEKFYVKFISDLNQIYLINVIISKAIISEK